MSSQVEIKRAFNKLKHELEPYRELLYVFDILLTWQQNFYPAIIFGIVTVFYLILWAMDLSIITLIALAGLIAIGFDYGYPFAAKFLFNADNWSGQQEERFEGICTHICNIKMSICNYYEYLFNSQERKSPVFIIILSIALVALAWIGAVIDNLLLMYLITLAVAMYPGISNKQVFAMVKEKISGLVCSKMQKAKDTSKKSE